MINLKSGILLALVAAMAWSVEGVAAQEAASDVSTASAIKSIRRVSTTSTGGQIAVGATYARISADGTKVGFLSRGTNLGGDPNLAGYNHLYVKNLASGQVTRVDSTARGIAGAGNVDSEWEFSPDGTRVVFSSSAANLVPGDTNAVPDIFEKTLASGAIRRLSVTARGLEANNQSYQPTYSRDGKKVAFSSFASNLVAGDTNRASDVFVKALVSGAVTRVSVGPGGRQGNAYSGYPSFSPGSGRIAFISYASNLGPPDDASSLSVFQRSLGAATDMTMINIRTDGKQALFQSNWRPLWSPSGTGVLFLSIQDGVVPADDNHLLDIYQRAFGTAQTSLLSRTNAGGVLNGASTDPAFAGSSSVFAFASLASNIVAQDTNGFLDVFVRDAAKRTTVRVSTRADGTQATGGDSRWPSLSKDGKKIIFTSAATNLVPGDTNAAPDVFLATLP